MGLIRALAELVLHLMLRATKQLPPEEEEEEAGGSLDQGAPSEDPSEAAGHRRSREGLLLPPPILPGNWAPAGSGCFLRGALKGIVADSKGFEAIGATVVTKAEAGPGGSSQRRGGSRDAWGLAASMAEGKEASAKLVFGLEAVLPQVVTGQQVSMRSRPLCRTPCITRSRSWAPCILIFLCLRSCCRRRP